jgi:hypothetical protein
VDLSADGFFELDIANNIGDWLLISDYWAM